MRIFDFFRKREELKEDNREVIIERWIFKGLKGEPQNKFFEGEPLTVQFYLKVYVPIIFDIHLNLSVYLLPERHLISRENTERDGLDISWLPKGNYIMDLRIPELRLRKGTYSFNVELASKANNQYKVMDSKEKVIEVLHYKGIEGWISLPHEWSFTPVDPEILEKGLSWQKGHKDWFYKHFDHAPKVIIDYMFDYSPLLKENLLDVGCGDGIMDLGIFLRMRPKLLVGIDIEGNFKELSRMMKENGLPFYNIPENLIFHQIDARKIPYPDDFFDVVISWALLEHIPGGYEDVLREIKRVLKNGGLFFLHPGLYYSSNGHHLGEFTSEPFVHLKKTQEELREIVFTAEPQYIDRGGLKYTREDFWKYYTELNKITVQEIEKKLRELGFEFKKIAVRAEDLVIYDQSLQKYSIQDLTTHEIYMALINRKR